MRNLLVSVSAVVVLHILLLPVFAGQPQHPAVGEKPSRPVWRVLEPGQQPDDARLGEPRHLRDEYHPWKPAQTKEAWKKQQQAIRKQVLVATGLWPMPPKTPLEPVVHGKIDRGDYVIEKVFFASYPGHYVTGNLYRPTKIEGRVPGVLCPHGHWRNGRFYDAGKKKARQQLDKGAEKSMAGARFPVQARMVHLARMGCIVFHYDMVGYADSQQIAHRKGFTDVEAGLRLHNFMGLQTWNSIRALDFLLSRPHVDPERIGVTGASGGGTQTFMLGAVDPRPDVAFPAVMVSTSMQGGCVCENASYLRQGINNIAIAALFAPRPLAMSGADDWTVDIETKGLPELKQVYAHYGRKDLVHARAFPQFNHNYNNVSRELMYGWFNKHLNLGLDSIAEGDFWPAEPPEKELAVFDEEHPLPDDAKSADELREYLTEVHDKQFRELVPNEADKLAEYRRVVGTAARVMLDEGVPAPEQIETTVAAEDLEEGIRLLKGTAGRRDAGEQVPWLALVPDNFAGSVVLWIDKAGKSHLFDDGQPKAAVRKLLDAGNVVASADMFLTGEFIDGHEANDPEVNETYPGYTFGYNRPVLANRVRDILTVIGQRNSRKIRQAANSATAGGNGSPSAKLTLVGTGDAGPWTLLAAALAGENVERAIVDLDGFRFGQIESVEDPMFLPGALKYGGIGGLAALAAPTPLTVAGTGEASSPELEPLAQVYKAAGGELTLLEELTEKQVVRELRNAVERRTTE